MQGSPHQPMQRLPTSQGLVGAKRLSSLQTDSPQAGLANRAKHCSVNKLSRLERKEKGSVHIHLGRAASISDQAVYSLLVRSLMSVAVVWRLTAL